MRYRMHVPFLLIAAFLCSASWAAEKPQSSTVDSSHKVWTNDDMGSLRSRGLITTFSEPAATAVANTPVPEHAYIDARDAIGEPRPTKTNDAEWYGSQAALLRVELEIDQDALRQQNLQLESVKALRNMEPGIALAKSNVGVTPEAGIDILETRIQEVQAKIDELADLARSNGILPGALRG